MLFKEVDSSIDMTEHMKSEQDRAVNIDSLNRDVSRNECNIEDEGNEKGNKKEQVKMKLKKTVVCSPIYFVKKNLMEMEQAKITI